MLQVPSSQRGRTSSFHFNQNGLGDRTRQCYHCTGKSCQVQFSVKGSWNVCTCLSSVLWLRPKRQTTEYFTSSKNCKERICQHTATIPASRPKQDDHKLKTSLGYTESPCLKIQKQSRTNKKDIGDLFSFPHKPKF